MSEIKRNIVLIIMFQGIVFILGGLVPGSPSVFHLHPSLYVLIVAAILSTVAIPSLQRVSGYLLLLVWAVIYIGILFFRVKIFTELIYYQIATIELLLLEAMVWFSHVLAIQIREQGTLMDSFINSVFPGRILNFQDAEEHISVELMRSRRHNRPLTLLVVKPEAGWADRVNLDTYKGLRREVAEHFTATQIGQLINGLARQTDLIMRDRSGQYIILCPETDFENSTILAERIQHTIQEQMGISITWGVSSFPEEALTIDGLLYKARLRFSHKTDQSVRI